MEDTDYSVPIRLVEQGTDWPAWITAVSSAAGLAILAGTALFAYFALRDARRTRHAQLIIEIQDQWTSREIRDSWEQYGLVPESGIVDLVTTLHKPAQPPATKEQLDTYYALTTVANLIETIGALASEKALTRKVIYKMWGGVITGSWQAWDTAIPLLREFQKDPDIYHHFEKIAKAMIVMKNHDRGKRGIRRLLPKRR